VGKCEAPAWDKSKNAGGLQIVYGMKFYVLQSQRYVSLAATKYDYQQRNQCTATGSLCGDYILHYLKR